MGVAARIPASYGGEQLLFSNKQQRGQGRGKGRMNGAAARRHSFPFLDDVASAPATPRASKSKVKNPLPAHRTGNVGQHFRHFSTDGDDDDDDDGNE